MDLPHSRSPEKGWHRQALIRLRQNWWIKTLVITLGMTLFFVAYFWILNHPQFPVSTMPLTAIDRLISFHPQALLLYLSLWFYVSLAPGLLTDRREIISYALAAVLLSVIGLGIFLFWPTAVPLPEINWAHHSQFAFLKSVDAAGNACPSLHVAFAVFTAVWFERLLSQLGAGHFVRGLNWLWCLGIIYSTVAIRQHVALDAIAGTALGLSVALANLRWLQRAA